MVYKSRFEDKCFILKIQPQFIQHPLQVVQPGLPQELKQHMAFWQPA